MKENKTNIIIIKYLELSKGSWKFYMLTLSMEEVVFEKLLVIQLVNKFLISHGVRM
jgi:hypothetical protein